MGRRRAGKRQEAGEISGVGGEIRAVSCELRVAAWAARVSLGDQPAVYPKRSSSDVVETH